MNVFHCRYEVVRDVAKEYFMMRMIEEEHPVSVLPGQTGFPDDFDIYWSDTAPGPDRLLRLKPY